MRNITFQQPFSDGWDVITKILGPTIPSNEPAIAPATGYCHYITLFIRKKNTIVGGSNNRQNETTTKGKDLI
jgi:hypothetical protein